MRQSTMMAITLSACAAAITVGARFAPAAPKHAMHGPAASWDARAAAAYLDKRMAWWLEWPSAARDHGTTCVSCHTVLPYALARPALAGQLGEAAPSDPERRLIDNVVKRVRLWRDVEPFYPDQTVGVPKTSESRGTEAVLNALILARRDAAAGALSEDGKLAFANLWALQLKVGDQKGAWVWLNFHNEPWEASGSPYLGAALAAIAVGSAPEAYASAADLTERLNLLRAYLQRGADTTHLLNRLMALWANSELAGAITPAQRQSIIDATFATQRTDGGWSTASLGPWKRRDNTPVDSTSDGYATGLALIALQRAGITRDESHVRAGINWLVQHQDSVTGVWQATSLNKARDFKTDVGKFMSDAATAYSVLALTQREGSAKP